MKKNTKIFNTEVIERLALSDNIPPFDEQRNGTQVIMIEEGKKTVIYDYYSMYCDADARKWRVEAYNRTDGRKYDRLCMCGGVYPTRKRSRKKGKRLPRESLHRKVWLHGSFRMISYQEPG